MRCRRFDYRYALVIQSNRPFIEEWQIGKINVIVSKGLWSPAADVYETDEKIYILLELAGADPDSLEILLYEDALVIEGKRELLQPTPKKGFYHQAEIRQGSFCFECPLSESFSPEQIETEYRNGLLSVIINKTRSER